ncbi:hypothetical protein LS73_003785 [Helicobacter muridarum]|uniref:DnaJ domain-containing protein n=1 Tax=Helicobacter muridarum TaxID=216 RepID=A0A377PUI5_9HELI|nr:TerB family tellurite resistance protein [Helicobacter muridarum]TLE00780.1 hypothetical protein LS73_003785 [Helicobacter muridarum]STQ86536.1 DnaJ domain-containing protein [Helicobacter muridarum]
MELILFFIAAGIIFYLVKSFKVYLSNPISSLDSESSPTQWQDIPTQEVMMTPKEKLKSSEYGILVSMLGKLSYADGKSCILEQKLVNSIIDDMAKDSLQPRSLFMEIYEESSNDDIRDLATLFRDETIGQYKKRVKVIEFMFALAYADGYFSPQEEDCIIDVAAILEIENEDFNALYDEFKQINQDNYSNQMSVERAKEVLGVDDDVSLAQLDDIFNALFQEKQQHILDHKNLSKPYNQSSAKELQEISQAYNVLTEHLSNSYRSQNANNNESKITKTSSIE